VWRRLGACGPRGWSARLLSLCSLLLLVAAGPDGLQPSGSGADAGTGTGAASVPASRQANNVAVITIEGEINSVTASSFKRRLTLAERAGADALVVELDTPGGELGAVLDISNMIKGTPIQNTVAWINDEAYSGGAVIALACSEIVTSDPATMGDALVISVAFGMLNQLSENERQKFLTPLIADMVDSARRNGYDEYLVQGIASLGVELWYVEDTRTGERYCIDANEYQLLFGEEPPRHLRPRLASAQPGETATPPAPPSPDAAPKATPDDGAAPQDVPEELEYAPASESLQPLQEDVSSLQEQASDRPEFSQADRGNFELVQGGAYVCDGSGPVVLKADDLRFYGFSSATVSNDEELKAFFQASHLRRLDMAWSEALASALIILTNPVVKGLLIIIFMVGLFLEMSSPGLSVPGAVAVAALVAFLAPPMLVGMAGWWEVVAVLMGIGLVGIEIFVIPGFGVAGITGLLLLIAGLVGTFVPAGQGALFPDSPGGRSDLLYGVATVMLAFVTSGVVMYFIARNFNRLPVLGGLILQAPSQGEDGSGDGLLAAMSVESDEPVGLGARGLTITPLRPVGQAEIGGRVVDVQSELGFVGPNVEVRIVGVGDLGRYIVEPTEPSAASEGETEA